MAEVGNHIGPQLSQPVEEGESSAPAGFRVARFVRTDEKASLDKLPESLPKVCSITGRVEPEKLFHGQEAKGRKAPQNFFVNGRSCRRPPFGVFRQAAAQIGVPALRVPSARAPWLSAGIGTGNKSNKDCHILLFAP